MQCTDKLLLGDPRMNDTHVFNYFPQKNVSNAFAKFNYYIPMCPEIVIQKWYEKINLYLCRTQVACTVSYLLLYGKPKIF